MAKSKGKTKVNGAQDDPTNSVRDKSKTIALVKEDAWAFQDLADAYKSDFDVAMAAVSNSGGALEYTSDELKENKEIVSAAVSNSGRALEYAAADLKASKEIVLVAVGNDGGSLEYASDELKADREVVLAAVSNSGQALEYAADELKADREVVLTAVSNSGRALEYAAEELKADKAIVIAAVSNSEDSFEHISEELKQDSNFLLEAYSGSSRVASDSIKFAQESLVSKLRDRGDLIDIYSDEWLEGQDDSSFLAPAKTKKFKSSHGDAYKNHLLVVYSKYLEELTRKILLIAYPQLEVQFEQGSHRPSFVFINRATGQLLCIGLGRKNRIFMIDSVTGEGVNVYGVGNADGSLDYIAKFTHLDHCEVVKTFVHSLHELSLELDARASIDDSESEEYEQLNEKVEERMGTINLFFPNCGSGDLDSGDY